MSHSYFCRLFRPLTLLFNHFSLNKFSIKVRILRSKNHEFEHSELEGTHIVYDLIDDLEIARWPALRYRFRQGRLH